ncbi:MAG: hypothetical protein ACI9LE_001444 [Paraglaciecola sp.]|jgi:hypothetical protein
MAKIRRNDWSWYWYIYAWGRVYLSKTAFTNNCILSATHRRLVYRKLSLMKINKALLESSQGRLDGEAHLILEFILFIQV